MSFGTFLGHIICKNGVLVDPTKVVVILNVSPPTSINKLRYTLEHTGYYHRFNRNYTLITTPLEKLLKKIGPLDGPLSVMLFLIL